MTGLAALLSAVAVSALPPLPERGLALETKAGVQLQTMSGKPLATVPGLDLAPDKATAHGLVMRDRRGRLFSLDRAARRVRRVYERPARFPGRRLTDARAGFQHAALRAVLDVGRLALLLVGGAHVDRAVELVVGQLALHVRA